VIVKKDLAEIDAAIRRETRLLAMTAGGLILGVAAVIFRALAPRPRPGRAAAPSRRSSTTRTGCGYANDIILLMRPDGTIIEANERAVTEYGYALAHLLAP